MNQYIQNVLETVQKNHGHEAVFVQSKQDVGKAVHEAAGGLAPNGLREMGSQHTRALPRLQQESLATPPTPGQFLSHSAHDE